jgi:hypothetical protein
MKQSILMESIFEDYGEIDCPNSCSTEKELCALAKYDEQVSNSNIDANLKVKSQIFHRV